MGRAMLLIVTGLFVIFGVIQLAVYERQGQISAINVNYWSNAQARNVANFGIESAFNRFATTPSWRTPANSPQLYVVGTDTARVWVLDNTTAGLSMPNSDVEIRSLARVNGQQFMAIARVRYPSPLPPIDSAIGIFTENLDFNVSGSAFIISGNDRNPDGTPGPETTLPGIAVNNAIAYNEIMNSLNSSQMGRIQGAAPDESSIEAIGGTVGANHPSLNYNPLADPQFLEDFITLSMANATETHVNYVASGAGSLGTPENPKIVVVSGTLEVRNATGAGVIIITETGSLDARGNFDNYQGLIIVQGNADMTRGNINIYGAMLFGGTNPQLQIDIDFRGNVGVQYSSAALDNVVNRLYSSTEVRPRILTYVD